MTNWVSECSGYGRQDAVLTGRPAGLPPHGSGVPLAMAALGFGAEFDGALGISLAVLAGSAA